jgi:folate-binding protein YgfZ
MPYTSLPSRSFIKISGEDAVPFLQGLVTNDVARVQKGEMLYAALLTPQGKFLHDFFMYPAGEAILLEVEADRREALIAQLSLYKLRSKVTIALGEGNVAAAWGAETEKLKPESGMFADPRFSALGYRMIGAFDAHNLPKATPADYERMRLSFGVPDGRDMIAGKSFLLEYGIDQLHGVDFKKGCYVGQEVTARTKYRGQVKKFIYKVEAAAALPPAGAPVMLGDATAGELRAGGDTMGLALLRIEHVEAAKKTGEDFRCETLAVKASLPPWVTEAPSIT